MKIRTMLLLAVGAGALLGMSGRAHAQAPSTRHPAVTLPQPASGSGLTPTQEQEYQALARTQMLTPQEVLRLNELRVRRSLNAGFTGLTLAEEQEYQALARTEKLSEAETARLNELKRKRDAGVSSGKGLLERLPIVGNLSRLGDGVTGRIFVDPNGALTLGGNVRFTQGAPANVTPNPQEARIDLDLEHASVRECLSYILERANLTYKRPNGLPDHVSLSMGTDVADDARITIHVKNVLVATALDLITQSGGAQWEWVDRNGKTTLTVQKAAVNVTYTPLNPGASSLFHVPLVTVLDGPDPQNSVRFTELKYTFVCPHCKGKSAMVRQNQQPKCPKCSRTFQSDWKFCPADGTKRPSSPGQWRYCPLCGKEVNPDQEGAR